MLRSILEWMGFAQPSAGRSRGAGGHGHTHGSIDPTIATTDRGIWAIKWSFVLLAITSVLQLVVVLFTGSVAVLADTIHNVGDAVTAIPLWIAFRLARRKPSLRFTYGYGRVEDLAGATIVLIILASAIVAGYRPGRRPHRVDAAPRRRLPSRSIRQLNGAGRAARIQRSPCRATRRADRGVGLPRRRAEARRSSLRAKMRP